MIFIVDHVSDIKRMERTIKKNGFLSDFFRSKDRIYRRDIRKEDETNDAFTKIVSYDKKFGKLVTQKDEKGIEEHVKYCT